MPSICKKARGSLTCPLDPILDKKGGASTKRKSVISCVEHFKGKLDLVDIWKSKNPDVKSFTWSQKSPPVFCRLDYWLISRDYQGKRVNPPYRSSN